MVNLLADLTVRFNTAAKRQTEFFYVPYSSINLRVVRLLFLHRCIRNFCVEPSFGNKLLLIKVAPMFVANKTLIQQIELVSKPGLRIYWSASELGKNFFRNNFQGFYILSTPRGVCTSSELILSHLLLRPTSGEVLLRVLL